MTLRHVLLLSKSRSIHLIEKVPASKEVLSKVAQDLSGPAVDDPGHRTSFDDADAELDKKTNEDVELVEYAPRLFYHLRALDKITNESLQESFDPQANQEAASGPASLKPY